MYKRVLVPVDGSDLGAAIVPFVLDIAGPLDIAIVLLHVTPVFPPLAADGTRVVIDEEAQHARAQAYLDAVAAMLEARGLRVETSVRRGDAVREILAATGEQRADLIAMSTHGRTGPARLLFGSVAEGVLRHADVPVLVMRHTETTAARVQAQLLEAAR